MSKILIHSHAKGRSEFLQQVYNKFLISSEVTFDKRSTESLIKYESPQVLVVDCLLFNKATSNLILDLRKQGFTKPVLVLTKKCVDNSFLNHKAKKSLVHFLYEPYSDKELLSLTKKLFSNPMIKPQKHQRHKTEQYFEFEILASGNTYSSMMTNLSLGGAHCICYEEVPVTQGELVRMNVKFDELNNTRVMNAKVVWKSKANEQKSSQALGLQFISDAEVYKTLLGG